VCIISADNGKSEENYLDEEVLLKDLQRLGFTINDSRIYMTLLKIGINSPAKIAEKSNVDRARVYDSLKRLVKRKIVEEEPVHRGPRYRAYPPKEIFDMIRNEYEDKIQLTESIVDKLENLKNIAKIQDTVWALQGSQKVLAKIEEFLLAAEHEFYWVITPDISLHDLQELADKIIYKKQISPEIIIKIAMRVNNDHKNLMNRLFHGNVELYHWDQGGILPFGIVLTENSFLQTYLGSMSLKPIYDFGFFMEHCSEQQLQGLKNLCLWVFSHLCKQVVFEKKKKESIDESNKNEY
jgi:sugar-specific transcriptional regulator TrmB